MTIETKTPNMGGGALKLEARQLGSEAAKKKGFTLAEVLITLAIIGVVAALTIPSVVAKYQKKQYYTQFMKAFNTVSNAKSLAEQENGMVNTWGLSPCTKSGEEIIQEKLVAYFKTSKVCKTNAECGITNDLTVSYLNYVSDDPQDATTYYTELFNIEDDPDTLFITADGVLFSIDEDKFYSNGTKGDLNITFDTNGVKGPNIYGRDIFSVTFIYGDNDIPNGGMSQGTLEEAIEDCTTDVESFGSSCAYRLLIEGKMNY